MANTKKQGKKEAANEGAKLVGALEIPRTRGRVFSGTVTKKFPHRVVLEFERTVFVKKFERFYKKKQRIHARLPANIDVSVGDYIKVQECRPLSKIIHAIVIEKVRSAISNEIKENKK